MQIVQVTLKILWDAIGSCVFFLTGWVLFPKSLSGLWNRPPLVLWDVVEPSQRELSASAFRVSYRMHPHHADAQGRVFGGEVLKLVDVVAGIASRRHTDRSCVTISVDRVIFLCPVSVGDVLHLSVSVNRSWGSSMETGIKIIKEDFRTGNQTYACHAYMTFVARPKATLTVYDQFWDSISLRQPSIIKVRVPKVIPQTVLDQKRYLLAGRRRGHRIGESDEWNNLLKQFREYVLSLKYPEEQGERNWQANDEELARIEQELIADSFVRKDPDVRVEDGMVVAEIPDHMEPIKISLAEIEKIIAERGVGSAFRRLSTPIFDQNVVHEGSGRHLDWSSSKTLQTENTLATTVWIVRPQHCNSMGVLFGGTLMRWLEEVANLSAGNVCCAAWVTAAIDSMTLRASAQPGHVVILRAVVVKVWETSVEVYCVAKAESREGKEIFISDAFISLVAIDHENSQPIKQKLKRVESSNIWANKIAEKSELRRQDRLSEKSMLQKVYK
ncbi:HotDog domain-containing protein [Melampsora americana]|nr:HotDog domain-containing protein [Melampsora americana]